jgi:hypothetical protein
MPIVKELTIPLENQPGTLAPPNRTGSREDFWTCRA